jgi:hypothetical protein
MQYNIRSTIVYRLPFVERRNELLKGMAITKMGTKIMFGKFSFELTKFKKLSNNPPVCLPPVCLEPSFLPDHKV